MNKITKICLTAALGSAFSLSAYAAATTVTQPIPVVDKYFNGIYVGAGAGVASLASDITQDVDAWNDKLSHHDSGGHDLVGNIFGGYGKTFDSNYLGAEIFFKHVPSDVKTYTFYEITKVDKSLHTAHLKTTYSYGGAIRVGYLPAPKTMIYVLAGVESTRFTAESYRAQDDALARLHRSRIAFMPGAGIETYLSDNLTVRTQYLYSDYPKFNHNWIIDENVSISEKINPARSVWTIDLAYYLH